MDTTRDDPTNPRYPHKYVEQIFDNAEELLDKTGDDYTRVCFGLAYVAAVIALEGGRKKPVLGFQVLISAYLSALDHVVPTTDEYKECAELVELRKRRLN